MVAVTPSAIKDGRYTNSSPNPEAIDGGIPRFKVGYITAPATADDGDTITFDVFDKFKMTKILAVEGMIHTTTDSVVAEEAPTTAVDVENLTITVGGATDNKKRFYAVYGL